MSLDPSTIRRDYRLGLLTEADAAIDPIAQFRRWFDDAIAAKVLEPNSMALATVDSQGQPTARIVLLKGFDERGFVFFTNYNSRKGRELQENPRAGLLFSGPPWNARSRIDGHVTPTTEAESETYFHSRPVASQISALASQQSQIISSRAELEQHAAELTNQYAGQPIPLPSFWGGYRVVPREVEFWQGRENRLHDRLLYTRGGVNGWKLERLSP